MKNHTLHTSISIWAFGLILTSFSFTTQAQDCFFETSYDVIEVANNGDGTCDYVIDLCAIVDDNAVLHSIEYSLMYDSDGDGEEETMVQHSFTPGIQIPSGNYCLSSSAPTETFSITTPCGTNMLIIITGTNSNTNEDCINLMEDLSPVLNGGNEIEEMDDTAELNLSNDVEINTNESPINNTTKVVNQQKVYPTLAQSVINFNVAEATQELVQIMISDINGNLVISTELEPGMTRKEISVDHLQTGYYWLVAQSKTLDLKPQQFMKAEF